MNTKESYLPVEKPTQHAVVDFLSEDVTVEMRLEHGCLFIRVKVSNGEGASDWAQHDFDVAVPASANR
jgi:hypothetical protein